MTSSPATLSPSHGRRVLAQSVGGLGLALVTILLLLWLAGVFKPKIGGETAAVAPRAVPPGSAVVPVERIRRPRVETAVGTIRPVHETAVASKLLAKVLEVNVQAGQLVKKGEVLVRLQDDDLQAGLRQAEAVLAASRVALERAQIEYDRVKPLYEAGSASKNEFDQADTALRAARAQVERDTQARIQAETLLEYATIRSPIDGKVIDKRTEVGDTAQPGGVLLTLYDPTRMQLVASVRESLTQRLAVGQTIGVQIEAVGLTCEGRISEIVPEAESASRTFAVKVTGPCPPGIFPGMFGRLLIPLDEEEVLVVPAAAVRRVGQLDLVEVVERGASGEQVRRRVVQLGRTFEDRVEVLSGLREGEQVLLATG